MRKSRIWLIVGIVALVVSLIVDRVISDRYNFGTSMDSWDTTMWIWFVFDIVMILGGIGIIIYSCVLAKREKKAALAQKENIQ